MSKFIDITGNKYGKLTVVERVENDKNGQPRFRCICECGNETVVKGSNLKSGAVKSCGCLRKEPANKTHQMSKTKLYRIWAGMKSRCTNQNHLAYARYGGRGINVCDEWLNSFETFRDWAFRNGYSENMSIERVDNDRDYCPANCTWIPLSRQAQNRSRNKAIRYNGEVHNLAEWCRILGVSYSLAHNRINKLGWSFERAVETPCDTSKRNIKKE